MNYNFKNITYQIHKNLNNLKITTKPINKKSFLKIHDLIFNTYSTINLNDVKLNNYNIEELIFNTHNCSLYDYLIYLNKQNLLDKLMINYNISGIKKLKNILTEDSFEKCDIWLNQYGKHLLNEIYKKELCTL